MARFLIGLAGIATILALAYALSTNRRAIRLRVVGAAFALQVAIAVLVLYVPAGKAVIGWLAQGVSNLLGYAQAGIDFIFGPLAGPAMGGHSFALAALPVIIFFAAVISILYYLGVMQFVVRWIGGAIQYVTGISKVESLGAAANIFVGQSEAPLVIRPYLAELTPSQVFCVMSVGMAGVAGTILAAYASMLGTDLLPYLLAASFMSAPGGILMAKMIVPDDLADRGREPAVEAAVQFGEERPANIIMAAAEGAQTGVKLAVAVGAMVLAFVALVALANGLLGGAGILFVQVADKMLARAGLELDVGVAQFLSTLSFQKLLGHLFAPVMFLLNVPWNEAGTAGGLFGTKIVVNEFVAFGYLKDAKAVLSPRTVGVITFALCGFANFSSIAIQMAVTGGLAPNQRPTIARLGLRALAAGSLANLMSAALAGLLIG